MPPELDDIASRIRAELSAKDGAREQVLRLCREVIRYSADSIRAIHRGEFDDARTLLSQARDHLDRVAQVLAGHGDILHAGFVHDSQKEYAEGNITLAIIRGEPLPGPDALRVTNQAYLNGMGEAVGELRRHLLDRLRRGEVDGLEAVLATMDDIYNVLISMDFPDAMTAGLRRTTDMVRGVLERTRGDLTLFLRQRHLEARLETLMQSLDAQDANPT